MIRFPVQGSTFRGLPPAPGTIMVCSLMPFAEGCNFMRPILLLSMKYNHRTKRFNQTLNAEP
jgi:hypothetical protein